MPNFDPAQELPDELEPTVISQPVAPTASGGGYVGKPSVADPAQAQAAALAAADKGRLDLAAWNAAHPGVLGNVPTPVAVAPAPAVAAAPVVPADSSLSVPVTSTVTPTDNTNSITPAAPVSAGASSPDNMSQAVGDIKAAGQNTTDVGNQGVAIAEEKAKADAEADRIKAAEAQASADRLQALQNRQKTAYDQSVSAFQKAKEDVANFKFHDYFANKSTASLVLGGIGMLLGGVSYDANHVNQAVNIIQTGIDRDAKQQLSYLTSKEHLAELANQGVRDTQSYLANEMANFHTSEALKKEAVARQIDELSSTPRGKMNINEAQAAAAKLREQAAKDAQAAIIQSTHNRVMQSEISLNRAKASNEGAARADRVKTVADTAYEKRLESLYKKNGQAIAKQSDEAHDLLQTAKTNPSALAQGLVLERVVALAQGGSKAGLGALKLVAPHAGSDPDKIISSIKESLTGNKGEAVQKNLQKVLENIANESDARLDKAKKTFDTSTASQRKKFGQTIDDTRTAIFGGDRETTASQPEWKPIPRGLSAAPALRGKTQVLVGSDGSIQDAR